MRLLLRPGVRKPANEDLTEERPVLSDCPLTATTERILLGGFGEPLVRLNESCGVGKTPHSDKRVFKCICFCCLEF